VRARRLPRSPRRRALAACLLALALAACGKYGPPVRQAPPPAQPTPAGQAQPEDEEERS
jgi:hypothetical protein